MSTDFGHRLRYYTLLFMLVLAVSVIGFSHFENLSAFDAIYFTIVTLATVGYGDIHPVTTAGKMLAIVVISFGVTTFVTFFASLSDYLLNKREKELRHEKLNMVIEIFFGEVGTELLRRCALADPDLAHVQTALKVSGAWSPADYSAASNVLHTKTYAIDIRKVDLLSLRTLLRDNTTLFLRILENPYLLEHEAFTETVRAVLHLKEELNQRDDIERSPETDLKHLAGDIQRAYGLLAQQWLSYMNYLCRAYPFLFSLAVRINPFSAERSAVVKE
ncbi:MAG TPA: potassium channel family protein [Dissulfurispiraceae bacterium]|nr:potassium channel family protein [Dissulfurispiraceae bacterium]